MGGRERRRLRRWGLLRLLVLVTLGLSLAIKVVNAEADDDDDDDIWEDIEDDEEPAVSSTRSRVSQNALVQLTDQNSEKILKSNEYVMLLGYASWCRQSAAVMVDYAEAALALKAKGSSVVLARIDAIVNTVTAGRYRIKGYPTVLFFRNGSEEIYPAGLSSEEIVNWIQKQTGHPTTTLLTEEEAREIIKRKQTAVVVGYFDKFDGPEYEDFVAASIEVGDVEFVQTTVAEAAGFFKPEMLKEVPSIGLFDSEDGFELMDRPLTKDAIVAFANLYKYPMVTKLHSQNVGKVYSSPIKKQVILFASEDDFEDVYDLYKFAALTFKNKLMFLWVDTEDEDFAKPMLTMYGIPDNEAVVAGFDNNNGLRYLMDAEVTEENLLPWAEKYLDDQLELHYKSERIPKENTGDVKVVVGKTFRSMVLESSSDVVLLVYTPYCYDCESMGKVFPKLAKHFKENSSLVFGKIDASANEHPALKVSVFPAVLFYHAHSESMEPVVGPSKPFLKKLVKFVTEQLQLQSAAKSKLSDEAEISETSAEVPDGQDGVSATLITDAESLKVGVSDYGLTETVSEVSLPVETVIDLPTVVSKDAEGMQVPDSEAGSAVKIAGASLPTDIQGDCEVGPEAPVAHTVPTEAAIADASVEQDMFVRDVTEQRASDASAEQDMDVKEGTEQRASEASVEQDRDVKEGIEHGASEEGRAPKDLSNDVSTEALLADSSEAERRAAEGNREVENLRNVKTSYKDEL